MFSNGHDTWTFAPGITLPIFDARLWSALDVTKAQKEIAVVQYEKAIQTALVELKKDSPALKAMQLDGFNIADDAQFDVMRKLNAGN